MARSTSTGAAVALFLTLLLTAPAVVRGNGGGFFPAVTGLVELAYFGVIKDARTGRPISAFPHVAVLEKTSSMFIPFNGDAPGHFISPDVGSLIRQATDRPVDPSQLEIYVFVDGHKSATIAKAPRQRSGRVELRVRMEPEGTVDTGQGRDKMTVWIVAGVAVIAVLALVGGYKRTRLTAR